MALITGNNSITKGTPATLTLDKSAVLALPSVMADAYYSVAENIKEVRVIYKSLGASFFSPIQRKELVFDFTQASPTDTILFSAYSQDSFDVAEIIVFDFDAGYIEVPANEIPSIAINLA